MKIIKLVNCSPFKCVNTIETTIPFCSIPLNGYCTLTKSRLDPENHFNFSLDRSGSFWIGSGHAPMFKDFFSFIPIQYPL